MPNTTAPNPALLLAACAALAVLAVPAAAAGAGDATDLNPCKPYPKDPTALDKAWCTAKGIGNATRILVDNVYDGNYTTLPEYLQGVREWKAAVLSCTRELGNSTYCPDIAVRFS